MASATGRAVSKSAFCSKIARSFRANSPTELVVLLSRYLSRDTRLVLAGVGQALTWPALLNSSRGADTALVTGLLAGGATGGFWLLGRDEGGELFSAAHSSPSR